MEENNKQKNNADRADKGGMKDKNKNPNTNGAQNRPQGEKRDGKNTY